MARRKTSKTEKQNQAKNGNGANLGFEAQLFLAADKLRGNLEPSDYKHVALGLVSSGEGEAAHHRQVDRRRHAHY